MIKTILITGSTDGIGKATAQALVQQGHRVLIHGRSKDKLDNLKEELDTLGNQPEDTVRAYAADLSDLEQVRELASSIAEDYEQLDVVINNAGVFKTPNKNAKNGMDIRFVVNTIAPYLLTKELLARITISDRVINLSSAAQAPVDIAALGAPSRLSDDLAYAQSKLAITMWSRHLADQLKNKGPAIIAINPASFIGSKMVKEAYGIDGKDLSIGVNGLVTASLSNEFANASGRYFDNDIGAFANPHPDAMNANKNRAVVNEIESILSRS